MFNWSAIWIVVFRNRYIVDLLICVSSGHKLHVIKYLDLQKWIAVVDTVHSEHRSWGDILKMLDAAK